MAAAANNRARAKTESCKTLKHSNECVPGLCMFVFFTIAPLSPMKHCGKANANSCKCSAERTWSTGEFFLFAGLTTVALCCAKTPAATTTEQTERFCLTHHMGVNPPMWLDFLPSFLYPPTHLRNAGRGQQVHFTVVWHKHNFIL